MMNTAELITRSKDFNPDNVTYGAPRVNKRGGKNIDVRYDGKKLCIQFPYLFTWGVNERVDDSSGRVSYDVSIVFNSRDENDPEGDYFNKLKRFEEKVLEDAVSNSKLWFGKAKMSREVAEAMMYPVLKYPKDKSTGEFDYTRNPNVKLKLPYWDEKFTQTELYDVKRNLLFDPKGQWEKTPVDLVPSKSHMKGLMQCTGVWFAGGRFGVTWSLVQAQVRPPVVLGGGFCMLDDSDDEGTLNRLNKEDEIEKVGSHVELAVNEVVVVSDGDEDEEEVEAPKKKKKRSVKKRKSKVAS